MVAPEKVRALRPVTGEPDGSSPAAEQSDENRVVSATRAFQPLAAGVQREAGAEGRQEVAELLGISASMVRKLDRTGRMPRPLRLGTRKVWDLDELRRWSRAGAPSRDRWEALRGGGR